MVVEKPCGGWNHCPAVFCSAVPNSCFGASATRSPCVRQPLHGVDWQQQVPADDGDLLSASLQNGVTWGQRQVEASVMVVCLCVCDAGTFPLPVSSPPLPSRRPPECHFWITLPLVHQIFWHRISLKKTEQIWPQRARQREQKAAAAAATQFGFLSEVYTLMGFMLSNDNFCSRGDSFTLISNFGADTDIR